MNSDKFDSLRKEYLKTETPSYLKMYGWTNLEQRLNQNQETKLLQKHSYAFALAVVTLMILGTALIFGSQPAKPGDNLYKVKILSDKIYSEITGNYEATIDKRAEEIIKLKNAQNEIFDEAAKQYQKSLDEAKDKKQNANEVDKEEFRKKLEEKEKEFQKISEENTKNQQKLQIVADQTRRTRGEVKGDKDSRKKNDDSNKNENQNIKNESNHGKDD